MQHFLLYREKLLNKIKIGILTAVLKPILFSLHYPGKTKRQYKINAKLNAELREEEHIRAVISTQKLIQHTKSR